MKKSKRNNLYLSIIGLVILLLLSPCKVRNFIQAELGISQTEVLNKSQTTISQSNCKTFEASKVVKNSSKKVFNQNEHQILTNTNYHFDFKTPSSFKHSFNLNSLRIGKKQNIPLYILYQHFKALIIVFLN